MNSRSIKLMVVISSVSFPEGKLALQKFLTELEDIEIVGVAYNKAAALRQLKSIQPDVLLIDLMLYNFRSIDVISYVAGTQPNVKILALCPEDPPHERVILALNAGALGYIINDADPTEIKTAIHKVFNEEYYLPLETTYEVLQEAGPDMAVSTEDKRNKLFQFVLGLLPITGLIAAMTGYLWREYWGQIGVRVVDLGVDASTRVAEFVISFFEILGVYGPLLFIDTWVRMIGNLLKKQPQWRRIVTRGKKIKLGKLQIGRLLFNERMTRVALVVAVLSITIPENLAGGKILPLIIGALTALVLVAHILGLKDQVPNWLKLTQTRLKWGVLSIWGVFFLIIVVLSIEVFFIGPDLRTDGLHGLVAPKLLDLSARPAMIYDLDEKHEPLGALYLGGNADLYVLYDPCKKKVRFIPVGSSRVELIKEIQCSSP
jgi:CheY-like chemotaxis protein